MITVKWNRAGYRAYRQSPSVQAMIQHHVDQITADANSDLPAGAEPFHGDVQTVPDGTVGMVRTTDIANRRHNARTNALLKALKA